MFNINTYFCRNHKKVMCDLEWVKDEEADVRHHLMTFDPYWLGSLDTAIRAAYDDLNAVEHQFRAKKPSSVEDDGHYLVRAFEKKTVAIRRTFPENGPMWQILNDGNWCSADFLDSDVEVIGVMDLDMVHTV